ncbi:hypothetical protein [Methylorubrum salsuginis]|uniref:hypothetical protein n=1 Tax=Methylorubrum salsuginis TaxID=414703 RepID=UPI001041F6BC|nr:hypothetical protein [Methylorubrum salsuginis]
MSDRPSSPPLTVPQDALAAVQSWDDLERLVSAGAERARRSKAAALKDLRQKGPAVRALCAELGIQVPPRKPPGPTPKPGLDDWILQYKAHGEAKLGKRGRELWKYVTDQVACEDSLIGEYLNITESAVKKRYYRMMDKRAE